MREIKFRAWDDTIKKMWFPSAVAADGRTIALVNQFGVEGADFSGDVIEQFTGLRDKNGREIYEGDILESPKDACGRKLISVVKWSLDAPCFYHTLPCGWNELTIIGNTHENPELLKERG